MDDRAISTPRQPTIRTLLRVVGPFAALTGLIFTVVGMVDFFSAFGGFQPPRLFWCCFVGMPLLFVGAVMSHFGYLSTILRYVAGESAPVTKDVANYMGEGITPGVKAVTKAVVEGIAEGSAERSRKP